MRHFQLPRLVTPLEKKISVQVLSRDVIFSIPLIQVAHPAISAWMQSRVGKIFRPHQITFHLEEGEAILRQMVNPAEGTLREHIAKFWSLSLYCHKLLVDSLL